jgi:YVTN family beta-propeller protein
LSNSLSVIDTATNTVIDTVFAGVLPVGVAVRTDGAFVYVPNFGTGTVSVINTATNTITGSITVGLGPAFIAFPARGPADPVDPIDSLIAQVQTLESGGSLTQNQAAGLIGKLEEIRTKRDNGQTAAACNQLSSFISQVNGFVNSGSLTTSQGQALLDAANAIKTSLGC